MRTGNPAEMAALMEPPEHVPGYRDLSQIGYGGFSVVYRAVQESVDRDVALKVLTSATTDEDARRRFVREVRLSGRLSGHPHVVTVLDTGTTAAGRPFLAMDLYDAGSMKEWLQRHGPLRPAQAAGVGAKIAEALAAAHELGVLHRDVKPNNILVSRYGEPALADFGVSTLLDNSTSGSVLDIFSPHHAAPELMTRGVPTAASDVYSLASSMYELLTGRPPFAAAGQDVRATMFRTVSEPAPRVETPEMPGLADAIERAMAKDPMDRFVDAAEFAVVLRALIPDGTSGTLNMADVPVPAPRREITAGGSAAGAVGAAGAAGTAGVAAAGARRPAEPDHSVEMTDEMYVYSTSDSEHFEPRADETMVRPDRVDRTTAGGRRKSGGSGGSAGSGGGPGGAGDRRGADGARGRRAAGAGGRSGGGHGGRGAADSERDVSGGGRLRKPLVVIAGVALVAAGVWAVMGSQGSPAKGDATASGQTPQNSATSGSAGAAAPSGTPTLSPTKSSSSSPTPTRHSSSSTPAHPTSSSAAVTTAPAPPPSVPTGTSSGPPLPGNYHRLQNAASGDCLTSAGGGLAHSGCGSDRAQGWEQSVPLTSVLGALTGHFELVNGAGGLCLTGGGGSVSVSTCTGSAAQMWAKTGGSGGSTEFQNAGDGQCLKTAGTAVTEGPCTGDSSALWNENGSV